MFKKSDPYTFSTSGTLQNSEKTTVGLFSADYQVTHYDDVKLSSGTVQSGVVNDGVRQYVLTCTQRIKIYNESGTNLSPQSDVTSYDNYPALLNTTVNVLQSDGVALDLLDYTPNTVNTQVQTAGTTGTSSGQTSSSSTSNTVGSSTSQTNSFGVSVGSFGDAFTSSVSAEHSSTTTKEQSNTTGSDTSQSSGQDSSSSASMSIKDWGGYCLVNPVTDCPSWTFGQEYPWDAIECRKTDNTPNPANPSQVRLVVPQAMLVRLYDGVSLYPPSHLSMFGINFVMKAQWQITVANGMSDEVTLDHIVNYFAASHILPSGASAASVYLDAKPTILDVATPASLTNTIDLGVLALAPLGAGNPAIVGFLPGKFVVAPHPAGAGTPPVPFKLFSGNNAMRVTDTTAYPGACAQGAGFDASETSMTATLTGNCASLSMRLLFKIVDTSTDYTLYLKHWKASQGGVMLTITINGDTANALTKYVDAAEAEGGENNLLSIALRNQDFASVDCHDYLTLGLNSIDIVITPIDANTTSIYQLRAVSIESA